MSKEVIASESAGAAQNKSVETSQDPEPALLEVGTLQSKSAEDVDGSSSLREPTTSKPQQVSVCQNRSPGITTPKPTAAITARGGSDTVQPTDFKQFIRELSRSPEALEMLKKEIFEQSESPRTEIPDDDGTNDNSTISDSSQITTNMHTKNQ